MQRELDRYDFRLPKTQIAQFPASPRESARLLVYNQKSGRITDDYFYNLLAYLPEHTTLVLNNAKVDKARLKFGKREVFLTKTVNDKTSFALVYPGKAFKSGETVELTDNISAKVLKVEDSGQRLLEFNQPLDSAVYEPYRQTPFPPYIDADEALADEYQTVYAKEAGSKAAPTAGLHFGDDFLKKVRNQVAVAEITLHVGLGTFAPLKAENLNLGKLHAEEYEISPKTARILNESTHITAVGTTSLRALEDNAGLPGERRFKPGKFETEIFIRPGYSLKGVDALITNFHLPKSSLLMLVAALVGVDHWRLIYDHAVNHGYRFYSFGDAMLII